MARKSRARINGESALVNLNCIHSIASDDGNHAAYHRNAGDCARWCKMLQAADMPWPQWMVAGNLKFFSALWNFSA
jgi:hypothetical protein